MYYYMILATVICRAAPGSQAASKASRLGASILDFRGGGGAGGGSGIIIIIIVSDHTIIIFCFHGLDAPQCP